MHFIKKNRIIYPIIVYVWVYKNENLSKFEDSIFRLKKMFWRCRVTHPRPKSGLCWTDFIHILKFWAAVPKTQLKLGFFGPNWAFLAQINKSLGTLYYSSQKPWFYSLNITTFCDTWYFKYEHMFGIIKNLIVDIAWQKYLSKLDLKIKWI